MSVSGEFQRARSVLPDSFKTSVFLGNSRATAERQGARKALIQGYFRFGWRQMISAFGTDAPRDRTTTLDTYGHLCPDADESTRIAIGAVIAERMKTAADQLRTTST
jgi:hypothetical protein